MLSAGEHARPLLHEIPNRSRPASATLFVLQLLERLAGRPEAVNARGNPAINRDLKEYLLDLILGEAIFQRGLDVQLQFMRPIERADHR